MDAETRAALEAVAHRLDRSMSATIRQLVRDAASPKPTASVVTVTGQDLLAALQVVTRETAPGVGR